MSLSFLTEPSLKEYAEKILRDSDPYEESCPAGFCWEMGLEFRTFRRPLCLSPFTNDFVLAVFCLESDLEETAAELARRSCQTKLALTKSDKLKDQLAADMCRAFTARAIASLANRATSRREVLARVQWITRTFPDGVEHEQAERMIPVLRRMVSEDDAYNHEDQVALKRPITPETLVYFLRDQVRWDIDRQTYSNLDAAFKSPAEQLLELGADAVPPLIEAIGDTSFTRIVIYKEPPTIQTVECVSIGSYAFHLLARIWGEVPAGKYRLSSTDPQEIERTKAILRKYWETVK